MSCRPRAAVSIRVERIDQGAGTTHLADDSDHRPGALWFPLGPSAWLKTDILPLTKADRGRYLFHPHPNLLPSREKELLAGPIENAVC